MCTHILVVTLLRSNTYLDAIITLKIGNRLAITKIVKKIIHLLMLFHFKSPKELWEAYSNRTVRPSVCPSRFRVRSISPIFFEVGILNLVCGYILGWRSVAYHFRVTVTLTSHLVLRIIKSQAYLLYSLS